ncbi:MAG: thioredoxin family protein [Saprospiraceae bacterium]
MLKMSSRSITMIISFTLIIITQLKAIDKSVLFSSINIAEAKKMASQEGKLIFMDFHAKWCSPCNWMDQTTFTDEEVIKILQEDFISLKIDIDNKEGYDIKNQYEVKYLPTILIFNSEGIMVERIEKTVTPRSLKEILLIHNEPVNKKIAKHSVNSTPTMEQPKAINRIHQNPEMKLTDEEKMIYEQEAKNKKIFKLQVGVFERYELAESFIQKLHTTFLEPVTVKNDYKDGKMLFRICLGQFDTMEEAIQFKKMLKAENQMESILY